MFGTGKGAHVVATAKRNPIEIFKAMAANSVAVQALRRPGKVEMSKLIPPPRVGTLRFRKGESLYGTLAAIRQGDTQFRFENVNECLDATFSIPSLLEMLKNGQTERILMRFGKVKISIKRNDLRALLVETGVLKK